MYADPDGSEHDTVNCSVAELTAEVDIDGSDPILGAGIGDLRARDAEKDDGVPIQPFADLVTAPTVRRAA